MKIMFEAETGVPLDILWRHYVEVDLRKKWETDLESLAFDGPIATGTRGTMKLFDTPPIEFVLSRIEENREFTDEMNIPGLGSLVFRHEMFVGDNGKNHIRQTVILDPVAGDSDKDTQAFFQQISQDIMDTVFRLKRVAGEYAG